MAGAGNPPQTVSTTRAVATQPQPQLEAVGRRRAGHCAGPSLRVTAVREEAGDAFVTLQSLTPIYGDFLLPQQAFERIKVGQAVAAKVDAYPGKTFAGEITAFNPRVDAATRNLQVRVTLANADHKLLPGMYATVDIDTDVPQRLVTLPQTAISYNPYGNLVYLVDDKGTDSAGSPPAIAPQAFTTTNPP